MAEVRVFSVDFNDAEGSVLEALAPEGSPSPKVGEHVVLLDGELNSCWGRVRGEDHGIVTVDLALDTWAELGTPTKVATTSPQQQPTERVEERFVVAGFTDLTKSATRFQPA